MPENGAHFSGEGHLIEGQIEGDVNKTIRPIVCDADGHLIIDLDASTITIGTVDQGAAGTDPWLVAIDQTGTNNNVDATVTNFPANQDVTVTNGAGAAAVNIQDGGNSITVDGPLTDAELRASPVPVSATFTPSGTQDVNIVSTISLPVNDDGGSLTVDGTVTVVQPTGTNLHVVVDSGTITTAANKATAATITRVATSTTAVTVLAADATRKKFIIRTESGTHTYIAYGSTASSTNYTFDLSGDDTLEEEVWTGSVSVVRLSGNGNIQVTDLT